ALRIRRDVADYLRSIVARERSEAKIEHLIELLEDPSMLRESLQRWQDRDIARGRAIGKEEGLTIGKQEGLTIGKQEGLTIGKQEGLEAGRQILRDVLVELLETRFETALSDDVRARIDDAPAEQLRTWSSRVLRVNALDDVFRDA
ncbi:MAG: hypothetical protein AAF772_10030, partial [Acidobacteriota bacterium]